MARLESIYYAPHRCNVINSQVLWTPVAQGKVINNLPLIFWNGGSPWLEANQWLHERSTCQEVHIRTIQSNATALHAYAGWLEKTNTNWWDFPPRKADRCLIRYRGALIEARDSGEIAPSTAQQRMNTVINFYRWLRASGLLSPAWPMWRERTIGIRLQDPVGLERTIAVHSTNLSIPNRKAPGERLEDGLLPLNTADRDATLSFAQKHASHELFLMLSLGFFTGMRIGTLSDLKIGTLTNAISDPSAPLLCRIAIGPGADPPVATKFGVTGHVWIMRAHIDELLNYAYSVRRLKREIKASPEYKDLVFLTRFGNPYAQRGSDKSPAINVEMHALRKLAVANGLIAMRNFHFHQSRCTFATDLAQIAIRVGNPINAVAFIKEALLHKHEATSFKYIKFAERAPIKQELANAFTLAFLGLASDENRWAHD